MTNITYNILNFANYKDIPNWSVQYADEEDLGFTKRFPMARIGSFLRRRKEAVDILDGVIYKRVTVSTKGGVISIRDQKNGKEIGTKKQFVIHEGQFLLSKIDARNGAYGVVPSIAEGAIITGNFWTYDVDYNLVNPLFLTLVTKTKQFLDFAEKCSNGTTNRHYLQENAFLQQLIPLPTVGEQNNIIDDFINNIDLARKAMTLAINKKSSIETILKKELGILKGNETIESNGLLKFASFTDITVWSVDSIINRTEGILVSQKYENVPMGNVIEINPKIEMDHLSEKAEISFIPMQSISEKYARWEGNDTCPITKSKGYTKFKEGDLIWAKITPCMQNGKSAVLTNLKNKIGCGSTEFYVLRPKNGDIDIKYIHCLLRQPFVLNDATRYFTGSAGQQRVPVSYLKNLSIPIPPIEIQHALVDNINQIMKEVEVLIDKSKSLEENAKITFRKIIFS